MTATRSSTSPPTAIAMPPPWLPPATATRAASTTLERADRVDRAHGVGEHAAVVVAAAAVDAAGHEARGGRPGSVRVRGLAAGSPAAALAARVHEEVRVAGRGPGEPLVGEAAPAAVAVVLHDGRQRARMRRAARDSQAFTGSPPKPGNVTSKTSICVSAVSTGVTATSPPNDRASAIVSAQNASKSAGSRMSGRKDSSSERLRSNRGTRED